MFQNVLGIDEATEINTVKGIWQGPNTFCQAPSNVIWEKLWNHTCWVWNKSLPINYSQQWYPYTGNFTGTFNESAYWKANPELCLKLPYWELPPKLEKPVSYP